jgi:hypothetical protein
VNALKKVDFSERGKTLYDLKKDILEDWEEKMFYHRITLAIQQAQQFDLLKKIKKQKGKVVATILPARRN